MKKMTNGATAKGSPKQAAVAQLGSNADRVGKEYDDLRMEKIRSPAAFYALDHILQHGVDAEDILVESVCAILFSADWSRIDDVVLLPSVCEVTAGDKVTDSAIYGLSGSWPPGRDGAHIVKYIFTSLHDVVRGALKRLRDISTPALELVHWYEERPTELFLPPELEHLRGKELGNRELVSILFVEDGKDLESHARQWVRVMGLGITKRGCKNYVNFAEVEAKVLDMLPSGFPFLDKKQGLKYSEALMVVRKHELDAAKATYRCMFQPVERNDIHSRIASKQGRNIFAKHGFREDDGSNIVLTTHKLRHHFFDTFRQPTNMDEFMASWSGRGHVSQNAVYDHVPDRDVIHFGKCTYEGPTCTLGPKACLMCRWLKIQRGDKRRVDALVKAMVSGNRHC